MNFKYLSFLTIALICLQGCNTHEMQQVSKGIDDDYIATQDAYRQAHESVEFQSNDVVSATDDVWLGNVSAIRENKNYLPQRLETEHGFTLMLAEKVNINTLANYVTSITDINMRIDTKVSQSNTSTLLDVKYSGKLSRFLTEIATSLNMLWEYDRGVITFYETQTKTFLIASLAVDQNFQSKIKGSDSNSLSLDFQRKEWEEIDLTIQSVLDGVSNAKYVAARATATITVTAPPAILQRIEDYVKNLNQRLSQQVAIEVRLLQVTLSDQNAVGFSLSTITDIVGNSGLDIDTVSNLSSDIVTSGFGIGKVDSSKFLIDALAKQGKISFLTSANITTRNGVLAPISNMQHIEYIAKFETKDFETNSTSTVQPETLNVGFFMQVLPHVLTNGRVMLMLNVDISELIELQNREVGKVIVQLPQIESRSTSNEVIMKSGETLVLSGFERMRNLDTRYGIGDPSLMALGGSRQSQTERSIIVVLVTPKILVSPLDPEIRTRDGWGAPLK
ncbi:MAG: hypothetical protein JJV93_02165 [Alphaproteobacteria bacterium]|nr:hypothetical protein [Alphaproteobacteria bacterium]MBL0718044.1 hypothetical protein [Alphaproteobacteria bacterium]